MKSSPETFCIPSKFFIFSHTRYSKGFYLLYFVLTNALKVRFAFKRPND